MKKNSGSVWAVETRGDWMTTGDPLNYLKTTIELALERKDLKKDFFEVPNKKDKLTTCDREGILLRRLFCHASATVRRIG